MLLNRIEYAMVNNPLRASIQRRFEARRLLRMGGPMRGGRALKPGGRFYCEEVLRRFIVHPVTRRLLEHPLDDRFDTAGFALELEASGLELLATRDLWDSFAWFTARKPTAA